MIKEIISNIKDHFSGIAKFDRESTMDSSGKSIQDNISGTSYYRIETRNWSMYGPFVGPQWSSVNKELSDTLEVLRERKLKNKK